jgi:hypothetical protein
LNRVTKFETVNLHGRDVTLRLCVNRRARHISLRVDEKWGGVDLILPARNARSEGLEFAHEKSLWILRQLDALPARVPFVDGAVIPILGSDHIIRHRPGARGFVWLSGNEIHVAGATPHLSRRVTDWLKKNAREEIGRRADFDAQSVGRKISRLSVRDTRSRWGSCSEDGHLSFSWRLILAPETVLDYVVAHEVAHLAELNHGSRFWKLVDQLCPGNKVPRHWLKRYGATLHRYG